MSRDTLCKDPETPTEWKSENATVQHGYPAVEHSFQGFTGVGAGDAIASLKDDFLACELGIITSTVGKQKTIALIFLSYKLAKARKMRKPPGTLSLKKLRLGKLWIEKVWAQNTFY